MRVELAAQLLELELSQRYGDSVTVLRPAL